MDDSLSRLTQANAREILAAFKLDRPGRFRIAAQWLARIPARQLSRKMLHFDGLVGQYGLAAGGRYILDEFTESIRIEGSRHVPPSGPMLAVANHPGVVDAMAIWVALERRPDLKIIAADRDILRLMPHTRSRLLLVDPRTGGRTALLRAAADHLRQGGALLNFPAGTIEPDPLIRPVTPPAGWARSSDLLLRLAPETVVLPVAVGGVISRLAYEHRIAKRFADPKEREWAAATLQVLCRRLRDTRTRVLIGEPIAPGPYSRHAATQAAMASLLERVAGLEGASRPASPMTERIVNEDAVEAQRRAEDRQRIEQYHQ
ncbi:MAG: 1-acyl-sn-glycerol-3-phosphate acyltransferase [Burkholderiaceae bacterium]